jgi:VWFA-related protein
MTALRGPFVAVVLFATVATVAARQQATFSSRTVAVRVDVLATSGGKPVSGLTADDFELADEGVLQKIDVLNPGDLPVNVVAAFDVSASTHGDTMTDLVLAGEALIDALRPDERASLTTFSEAVSPRIPLTTDHAMVRQVLRGVTAGGQTAIIDGIYAAMMTAQSEDGRPLVMVFTDGRDTVSWLRTDELIQATKRSGAVVYTVASGPARQWAFMKDLAAATGGRAIALESTRKVRTEFARILTEFRSRYVLSFSPTGVSDSGYHTVTVRSKRKGIEIQARPGYTAAGMKQ